MCFATAASRSRARAAPSAAVGAAYAYTRPGAGAAALPAEPTQAAPARSIRIRLCFMTFVCIIILVSLSAGTGRIAPPCGSPVRRIRIGRGRSCKSTGIPRSVLLSAEPPARPLRIRRWGPAASGRVRGAAMIRTHPESRRHPATARHRTASRGPRGRIRHRVLRRGPAPATSPPATGGRGRGCRAAWRPPAAPRCPRVRAGA